MADGNNPRAVIGDNFPPELIAYEAHRINIEGLYEEAVNWMDGEPIASQEQADQVQTLMRMIQEAEAAAEVQRKADAKPFDDGKAEVQARYNPLIADAKNKQPGKCAKAIDACKKALAPWLTKLRAEQERVAEAARAEAQRKAEEAAHAVRAANAQNNLAAREIAEALVAEAASSNRAAGRAEAVRPSASGYGRAAGLRDQWSPVLTDGVVALRHYWTERRSELEAFALTLAKQDVQAGKRQIPGFDVVNNPVVV